MPRPPLSIFATAAIVATALSGRPAAAGELTVVIDKLRSTSGMVHLALWNSAMGFTRPEHALIRSEQPAAVGQVRFDLGQLAPGRYALASFHDENGNGEFDQTWIGWPDEGLGFSNGAWISLGRPNFEDAAFELRPASQVLVVPLRYPEEQPAPAYTQESQ